jgi:hypothetical protein
VEGRTGRTRPFREEAGDAEITPGAPWVGRGAWVWYLSQCGGVAGVIERCQRLGMAWVAVKIADGLSVWHSHITPADVAAIQAAGIRTVGWVYTYGDAVGEAATHAQAALDYGVTGLIVDAEAELRDSGNAASYAAELKGLIDDGFPLGAALLPVPQYHAGLDYDDWYDAGYDLHFQVYENELGSRWPVDVLFDIYAARNWDPARIYPLYGAYAGATFTPDEAKYRHFFDQCATRGYPGNSMWRLDTMDEAAYLAALEG